MAGRRLVRGTLALATAAALGAGSVARADFGKDEKKVDNLVYPAEFRARVQQSILRGASWLLMRQKDDGSWGTHGHFSMGPTALAMLALV
jgi:hypothetical protein